MTDTVLREFKRDIDELTLVPCSSGEFEVHKNGEKIYSKKNTGEFPDESAIVEALR